MYGACIYFTFVVVFSFLFFKRRVKTNKSPQQLLASKKLDDSNESSLVEQKIELEPLYIEKLHKWIPFSINKTVIISDIADNLFGIQIGLNYVRLTKKLQLRGCINDAFNIRTLLLADRVPETNLVFFSDFTMPATKNNIRNRLQHSLQYAPPGSSHLVSFSGHGTRTLQHETICVYNENLATIDFIFDEELFNWIEPILSQRPNSKLTFIADSCFSENVLNLQYTYYPNKSLTDVLMTKNTNYRPTTAILFVISGSTKYQTSADFDTKLKIAHGALTYTLLRFLSFYRFKPFTYKDFILGINYQLRINEFTQTSCLSCSQPLDLNQEMTFPPI